ncbi:hypothetical protein JTE90_027065 [Oedothorax gibbosus]|uniref:Uncharacterized protein n=1 Tax=Oedothorax gibbosus TaxID=931172 RepID=A0AAV6TTJ7_9ARAC|nr:hypothetical protein JTE90_027065 [Oedothorax gibbosus]
MENLKEVVTSSLETFKTDIREINTTSSPTSPSFADVVATGGGRDNVSIFVDLPKEGEESRDFMGFKSALGVLLSNDSVKCSGIYETKKGVKFTAPSINDANRIKESICNSESLSSLRVNIISKEPQSLLLNLPVSAMKKPLSNN